LGPNFIRQSRVYSDINENTGTEEATNTAIWHRFCKTDQQSSMQIDQSERNAAIIDFRRNIDIYSK
jgi:hypothetical protein